MFPMGMGMGMGCGNPMAMGMGMGMGAPMTMGMPTMPTMPMATPMAPNPMAMMMMASAMSMQGSSAMSMQGGAMSAITGNQAASGSGDSKRAEKKEEKREEGVDPDVQQLCDHFNIEERWITRLNELMKRRRDTKEQDLAKLYEVLEGARSPTGLLVAKIGEMECGQFVGKVKPDKHTERLARQFNLDKRVVTRLVELRVRRSKSAVEDFKRLEQHLKHAKRPSATATLLIGKLLDGEIRQIPDMAAAEALAKRFRLDTDAKSKLREIVEKRAADIDEVLEHLDRTLGMSSTPSATLCKIAATTMDGARSSRGDSRRYENDDRGRSRSADSDSSSGARKRSDSSRSRSRSRGRKEAPSAAKAGQGRGGGQGRGRGRGAKAAGPVSAGAVKMGGGTSGWVTHET